MSRVSVSKFSSFWKLIKTSIQCRGASTQEEEEVAGHFAIDYTDENCSPEDDTCHTVAGCAGHECAAGGRHGLANTLSEV